MKEGDFSPEQHLADSYELPDSIIDSRMEGQERLVGQRLIVEERVQDDPYYTESYGLDREDEDCEAEPMHSGKFFLITPERMDDLNAFAYYTTCGDGRGLAPADGVGSQTTDEDYEEELFNKIVSLFESLSHANSQDVCERIQKKVLDRLYKAIPCIYRFEETK